MNDELRIETIEARIDRIEALLVDLKKVFEARVEHVMSEPAPELSAFPAACVVAQVRGVEAGERDWPITMSEIVKSELVARLGYRAWGFIPQTQRHISRECFEEGWSSCQD